MSESEKIELLERNGFKKEFSHYGKVYIKTLRRGDDRFGNNLYVYPDELNVVYINRFLTRGLETISEETLLDNHNELHTNAKYDYLETMKNCPFLKSIK